MTDWKVEIDLSETLSYLDGLGYSPEDWVKEIDSPAPNNVTSVLSSFVKSGAMSSLEKSELKAIKDVIGASIHSSGGRQIDDSILRFCLGQVKKENLALSKMIAKGLLSFGQQSWRHGIRMALEFKANTNGSKKPRGWVTMKSDAVGKRLQGAVLAESWQWKACKMTSFKSCKWA